MVEHDRTEQLLEGELGGGKGEESELGQRKMKGNAREGRERKLGIRAKL